MLHVVLDILEDTAALQTVDHLVVEGQEHVYLLAGADGAVRQNGRLQHRAAKAADGRLGQVDDGRSDVDGEHTHVGDGKGAAGHGVAGQALVLGLLGI